MAYVGIYLFVPSIPNYPKAKFPGVVVFSEIYQGKAKCRNIDSFGFTSVTI